MSLKTIMQNRKQLIIILFFFLNAIFLNLALTDGPSDLAIVVGLEDADRILPSDALDETSWSFNLSEYSLNNFEQMSFTLETGIMYNFSVVNNGSANFDVCLVVNLTATDYITQVSTSVYSDDLLQVAGVPMWNDYDTWDNLDYSNQVSKGIFVSSGTIKNFLLYVSEPQPVNVTWLVILTETTNTLNNTLKIEYDEIDLATSSVDVQYSSLDRQVSALIPTESSVLLNLTTENQADLTKTILNESLSVNDTITMIRWQKDLSGNLIRRTDNFNTLTNMLFVPEFENLLLDGISTPGIVINPNLEDVQLEWNFTAIDDATASYNASGLENSDIEFKLGKANVAWKVFTLNESEYFDISFGNTVATELIYWDISVEFYAIGTSNPSFFTLDSYGDNQSETATFFASSVNTEFENSQETISPSNFPPMHYWWAEHGIPEQTVADVGGTHYLGLLIRAVTADAYLNLTCEVTINSKNLSTFENGEVVEVGNDNGLPFDGFEMFHVREFEFANFTQYEWKIQSNTALFDVNKRLFCRDDDNYLDDMNNALISTSFDTLSLNGDITLEFEMSAELRNDQLYLYVQNSTDIIEIASFTGSILQSTFEYDISAYTDSNVQIILNMTSDDKFTRSGPIVDNVRVSNETTTVFFDDFSGDLTGLWTQVDNTDSGLLLWNIQSEDYTYSTPAIDIVYPNSIGTFVGYSVNPEIYNVFVKTELKYNPFVQKGTKGYIIYKTDEDALYQNFSMVVNRTAFSPINLEEIDEIATNHQYSVVAYENYVYYDEIQESPEFYEYYYLDLEPDTIYEIEFTYDTIDVVLLYAELFAHDGIGSRENFPDHFGFFVINGSYRFQFDEARRIYIKLDAIEPGLTIKVRAEIVKDTDKTIRNLSIATGIFAAIAAGSLGFIGYERKDVILSKFSKKSSVPVSKTPKDLAKELKKE